MAVRIGIDVGGSGVKAGLVDVDRGVLVSERLRVETPEPATVAGVGGAIADLLQELGGEGPLGIGFPAVVEDGWVSTANNIDKSWIGVNAVEALEPLVGRKISICNDADAAGLAETTFGAGKGVNGTVLILTFGTGIGSALFVDGKLVPNLELGQIELSGVRPAELRYSARARRAESLEWDEWGDRANEYLLYVCSIFNPHLVVIGGGASRKWELWNDRISPELPIVAAHLGNDAGIVGAALLAV